MKRVMLAAVVAVFLPITSSANDLTGRFGMSSATLSSIWSGGSFDADYNTTNYGLTYSFDNGYSIDYSVRIGDIDYGSAMRLRVELLEEDIVLMSTGPNGGEVVMARAGGLDDGYVELKLEPGWSLKRRHYGERALGHLYVHNESLPIRRDQEGGEGDW